MLPLSACVRRVVLVGVVALFSCLGANAQIARRARAVPAVGVVTQAASGISQEENFVFVAQTTEGLPGVGWRLGDPDGTSWTPEVRKFVDPTSQGLDPTVVVVGEEIYLCWVERRNTLLGEVKTMWSDVSLNEGETWLGIRPMYGPGSGSSNTTEGYVVGADPGRQSADLAVLVSSRNLVTGARELVLYRSRDLGATYDIPRRVPTASSGASYTSFAVERSGTRTHVVWTEEQASNPGQVRLLHRALADSANAFGAEQLVRTGSIASRAGALDVAVDADGVAITWLEPSAAGADALFLGASTDAGASFQAPLQVGGPGLGAGGPVIEAQAAVDAIDGAAVIAWSETRNATSRVFARRVALGSGALGSELAPFAAAASEPRLLRGAADAGRVLLSAAVSNGVRGALSENAGASFGGDFPLLELASGESARPSDGAFYAFERDFALGWIAGSGTNVRQIVGGVRPQTVAIRGGAIVAGAPLVLDLFGFPADPGGIYSQVLFAFDRGETIFPGLLPEVGLELDALFLTSLQVPAWQGFLDANGRRSTLPIGVPLELRGQALWLAAVALNTRFELVVTDAREELVR